MLNNNKLYVLVFVVLISVLPYLQPRYVVNRVTAGDYDCPRKVLAFLTDLHAAFRMLNLRNDFLRKKFDGKPIADHRCARGLVHLLLVTPTISL